MARPRSGLDEAGQAELHRRLRAERRLMGSMYAISLLALWTLAVTGLLVSHRFTPVYAADTGAPDGEMLRFLLVLSLPALLGYLLVKALTGWVRMPLNAMAHLLRYTDGPPVKVKQMFSTGPPPFTTYAKAAGDVLYHRFGDQPFVRDVGLINPGTPWEERETAVGHAVEHLIGHRSHIRQA